MAVSHKEIALAEFVELWTMDEMPACPVGMALLKDFWDGMPHDMIPLRLLKLWAALSDGTLIDSDSPELEAYWDHRNTCGDCNEADR